MSGGVDEAKALAFAILEHLQGSVEGEGVEEALATLRYRGGRDGKSKRRNEGRRTGPVVYPLIKRWSDGGEEWREGREGEGRVGGGLAGA